jgi:hypothetical protein
MFSENFMLISRKVMVWLSILCSNVVLVKILGSHLKAFVLYYTLLRAGHYDFTRNLYSQ